ncbi:MAG: DUF6305 family protein [Clostridia bacterium]|jgi:hypothetical protein
MKRVSLFLLLSALVSAGAWAQPTTAFAEKPALLTSVGQSADLEMVKVLLTRARVPFATDPLAMAADLPGNAKTLVLVVGGSSKGLGAAGISADVELERAKALIKRARELNMKILAVHVGGEARRGTLSDVFIELCVPAADYALVVADADKDGLFTRLASEARIALTKVEKITAVGAPLAAAFK